MTLGLSLSSSRAKGVPSSPSSYHYSYRILGNSSCKRLGREKGKVDYTTGKGSGNGDWELRLRWVTVTSRR
jgi:hypothetical protein